jgi:formylglycine-generating enzyme required for sulfatase activity
MARVFCCALQASSSPDVSSLSGRVTDSISTAGISGVRLNLKKYPRIVAITDANGDFSFSRSAVLPGKWSAGRSTGLPYIRNNRLVFSTTAPVRTGAIEVFALSGARISMRQLRDLHSGTHRVALPKTAHGVNALRLTVGNESFRLRCVMGIQGTCISAGSESLLPGFTSASGKTTASGFVDTLVVYARGYRHSLLGIMGYATTDSKATLSPSKSWKPSGALTHEKGMVKILAKGYDYEMGQPDPGIASTIGDTSNFEVPVHTVSFSHDFWMDTSEVTQKDFDTLMKATYTSDYIAPPWHKPFGIGGDFAVYNVTWGDAALYCNARSKREGLSDTAYSYRMIAGIPGQNCVLDGVATDFSKNAYRLPTEAEWEYACKGGTATDFYWGKNFNPYPATSADTAEIGQYAKWLVNGYQWGRLDTIHFGADKIAKRKPNAYGLYDMIGNVSEFCNDNFGDYGWEAEIDPKGPSFDPDKDEFFPTLRGGHWGSNAFYLRSANRSVTAPDYPYNFNGFRVCKTIKE